MKLKDKRACPNCGAEIITEFETAPANVQLDLQVRCKRCGWGSEPGRGLRGTLLQQKMGS
jgi:predicted Zn finger-like uncharacterized protein